MNRLLLAASFAMLVLATGAIQAKEGKIIKGNNGTKWCCPGGKVSAGCEKGAASTPVGASCNFASVVQMPKLVQSSVSRRSNTPLGKLAAPSMASATLNINTAGKPELSPVQVLTSDAKWHILNFRQSGPYTSGADFASRVCSRVVVDFGATDILIGSTLYQGFKCTVVASGSYWADGGTHAYP